MNLLIVKNLNKKLCYCLCLISLLILGCNSIPAQKKIPVTNVSFEKSNISISVNKNEQLKPVIIPENATNKSFDWKTSNPEIVSISKTGVITGLSVGVSTITAKSADGVFAQCLVTVSIPVERIFLDKSEITILPNAKTELTATISPQNATDKSLFWESSDVTVSSVSQAGLVSAVGIGVSTITVKSVAGNFRATCIVKVENEKVTDIDGNVYDTVKIGNQVWTTTNLRVTRYNDGTPIPLGSGHFNDLSPYYCFYNNSTDKDFIEKFGALYSGGVIANTNKKLAPKGWHIPTLDEINVLKDYLIANGYNFDGTTADNKIGKSIASSSGWKINDYKGSVGESQATNNKTRLNILPAGCLNVNGQFVQFGNCAYFWTITNSPKPYYGYADHQYIYSFVLAYSYQKLDTMSGDKTCAQSVRLIKD